MKFTSFALAFALALLNSACVVEVSSEPPPVDHGAPPQTLAQLDYPFYECESGPYSLALMNRTEFFLEMTIDGEYIDFLAPEGSYAELPPWTTAYLCLDYLGYHTLTGLAFFERYGELYEVHGDYRDFGVTDYYGSSVAPSGRQELFIDPSLLYYY